MAHIQDQNSFNPLCCNESKISEFLTKKDLKHMADSEAITYSQGNERSLHFLKLSLTKELQIIHLVINDSAAKVQQARQ